MNKKQREPYLILTKIYLPKPFKGYLGLCHFCKYADWSGSCSDAELECHHPLSRISDEADTSGIASDCWGFRPLYKREDCVDLIGLYLQGIVPDFSELIDSEVKNAKA